MQSSAERMRRSSQPAPTLAETAYIELRRQILTGIRAPRSPLRLEHLKQEFGMGFTPLREAMLRLTSEGFIDSEEKRGFRVAAATSERFDDFMVSRARIEAMLLEDAIRLGDHDWEATIVADFHRLSRRERLDPETGLVSESWNAAHKQFHLGLIAASQSKCLKDFWESLFDQAHRYRQIAVTSGAELRDDHPEHQRLMESVISRDVEAAISASKDHIESTRTVVMRLMFSDISAGDA